MLPHPNIVRVLTSMNGPKVNFVALVKSGYMLEPLSI